MSKIFILHSLRHAAAATRARGLLRTLSSERATDEKRRRAVDSLIASIARGDLPADVSVTASEGLFRRWDALDEVQRARLMRVGAVRWRDGLARLVEDSDPAARRVAAGLGERWAVGEAIRVAGRLVFDRSPAVADQAERSLVAACKRAGDLNESGTAALDETLAGLVGRFDEHRRRGVLRAAVSLGELAGPRLRSWLRTSDGDEMMALRSVVKESGVVSRGDALRLLGEPGLRGAAAARLEAVATAEEHEETLALAPLLMARGRARALTRLERPLGAIPAQKDMERLGVPARMGALRWAAAAPVASGARVSALAEMLEDSEPAVRLGAVARLGELGEGVAAARDALVDAVFDDDARVARAAWRELLRSDERSARGVAERLLRSPHAGLRTEAEALVGADAWAFVRAGHGEGWRMLRRSLRDEPLRALGDLRGRINEGEVGERTLAVLASRRLGVTGDVEGELLGAVRDDDARVASAAVGALGENDSAASRAAVSTCLAHTDPRVRSNAVEAIARRDPDESVVRAWVDNEVARARGNAVRARVVLARDARGRTALEKMLGDSSRGHRLSGLWVAERAGDIGVSERVAELARTEQDPALRQRARRCARRLLAEMRARDASADAGLVSA